MENRPLLFSKVSFEVKAGETLAILGPNGIGKTTLLRCVMRFLALKEGEIEIDGAGAKHTATTNVSGAISVMCRRQSSWYSDTRLWIWS